MTEERQKLSPVSYIVGGLSFIPAIGIVVSLIVVTWGLATNKLGGKKLAAIGAAGLAFNIAIYSALFYFGFVQRGGAFDDLRSKMVVSMLDSLVPAIEMYKLEHGAYPQSLDELQHSQPPDSLINICDPTDVALTDCRQFYYKLVDKDHYYLLGVGADGRPLTADDVQPSVPVDTESHIGLLKKREP